VDCFIHQTYGRVRVRVPHTQAYDARIPQVLAQLRQEKGVRRVHHTLATGSIVVQFDPKVQSAPQLLKIFQSFGLLANVIGFPRSSKKMQHRPQTEVWERVFGEALEGASKNLLRSALEIALSKGGQMLWRKLLGS
jgi:hypothetical protein